MDSLLKGECTMKCRAEYENELAKTRDQRMKWWRDANIWQMHQEFLYVEKEVPD